MIHLTHKSFSHAKLICFYMSFCHIGVDEIWVKGKQEAFLGIPIHGISLIKNKVVFLKSEKHLLTAKFALYNFVRITGMVTRLALIMIKIDNLREKNQINVQRTENQGIRPIIFKSNVEQF